jgi:hypothetical protein
MYPFHHIADCLIDRSENKPVEPTAHISSRLSFLIDPEIPAFCYGYGEQIGKEDHCTLILMLPAI